MSRRRRGAATTAVGVAALLLVGACSGDDGDRAQDAGGDPVAFCEQAGSLDTRLDELNQVTVDDPEAFRSTFEDISAFVSGIEPPSAIADEWRIAMSVFTGGRDVDDAALDQATITEAGDAVVSYLRDECGVELGADAVGGAGTTGTTGATGDG